MARGLGSCRSLSGERRFSRIPANRWKSPGWWQGALKIEAPIHSPSPAKLPIRFSSVSTIAEKAGKDHWFRMSLKAKREFRVVLMGSNHERQTFWFSCEDALVMELRVTYRTMTPIELTYDDGSAIEREVMDRIHQCLFAG